MYFLPELRYLSLHNVFTKYTKTQNFSKKLNVFIKSLINTCNNCYYLYIYLFTGQREWKGQFVSNFNTLLFCLCLNRLGAQNRVAAPLISNLWSFRSLLWNVISRHHSLCKLAMLCFSVDHFPFLWSLHTEWKSIYCWF